MAVFTYTAKDRGSLVAGHSEGTEYSIEIGLQEWTPKSKRYDSVSHSLSGKRFTVLDRIEKGASFQTVSTDDQGIIDELIEMFDSVAAGEVFKIDPYGTILEPGSDFEVMIDGDYSQSRAFQTEFSFSAKVEFV